MMGLFEIAHRHIVYARDVRGPPWTKDDAMDASPLLDAVDNNFRHSSKIGIY